MACQMTRPSGWANASVKWPRQRLVVACELTITQNDAARSTSFDLGPQKQRERDRRRDRSRHIDTLQLQLHEMSMKIYSITHFFVLLLPYHYSDI